MSPCAVTKPCGQNGIPHSASRLGSVARGRLEDGARHHRHAELTVHPAQPRQGSFAHLADQLHGQPARLPLRWGSRARQSLRARASGQGGRHGAIANDLDLPRLLVDVLEVPVVDRLCAQPGSRNTESAVLKSPSVEVAQPSSSIMLWAKQVAE